MNSPEPYPGFAADLEGVVRRTRHERYRLLTDPARPEYRPAYVGIVRELAARLRGEPTREAPPAPGPIVPGTMATILGCDYRLLRYPDEEIDGCQCSARCLRGKGWPDGIVTLSTCLECVR